MAKRTLLVVAVSVGMVSCEWGESRGRGVEVGRPRPQQTAPSSDETVIQAALDDLATYVGEDSPVASPRSVETPLLVAPDSADWPVTAAAVLKRHDPMKWRTLPRAQEPALAEAAEDLASRAAHHAGFVGFRSSSERVRIFEPKQAPEPQYPFLATRPIRVWPPGFSADRRIAVVHMSVPWSIHHATGTYVFASVQGDWSPLVRQFAYYP